MNAEFQEAATRISELVAGDCAVVLIGSAARGCRTEDSDIDLLVIAKEKLSKLPVILGYHIKDLTDVEFLNRLRAGEDFEAWCVRFGVPLVGRGLWERVKELGGDLWPKWETKVIHGSRRLFLASQLSKMGDSMAAREELIFVLGHIARGLLLKAGTFPLSRPELAAQVRSLGYPRLAELHERLRSTTPPTKTDLSLSIRYSKRLLIHLNRDMFGNLAKDHARVSREKLRKRSDLAARTDEHVVKESPVSPL
jgi:predicted nucleotidyltransferase